MTWKPLGRKRAREIMRRLKEIRRTATMSTASFGFNDKELTSLIREETRIWRNSWIIYPLDAIIAEFEEVYKLVGDDA